MAVKRKILLTLACAVCVGMSLPVHADSPLEPIEDATAPHVLSSGDAQRYRTIMEEERIGNFAAARSEIDGLSDHSLMGYVEAEHYLSPRAKRTPLSDLAAWLEKYDDLPIAARVHELAERRNRRHKVELAGIPAVRLRGGGYEGSDTVPEPPLSSDVARAAQAQIEGDIRADQPALAESVLQELDTANTAPPSDITRLTQRVAASYLAEGQDTDAYRVATSIAGMDREAAPMLDWEAGLAAYRLSNFADAATHFESLAQTGSVPGWTRGAAAFWAARAHLQAGDPLRVVSLLTAAAREQPTFYGMLAERMLGQETQTQFSDPVLDPASFEAMMQVPSAHRAVALWQIGETQYIQPEMTRALAAVDLSQTGSFAALAHRMDLPDLELRASETQASRGVMLTGLFPMPRYSPPGGYQIDPCLVLAFARIESRFQARAVSSAGARGVMQIMPGTATHVDGEIASARLNDPAYSLGLGQRYLRELLDQVNGNLFQLAAAYNAGPGSLTHWIGARPAIANDPLLFIESLPAPETRNYIKRVMTYYWMYARRSGQSSPSLQETAEGKWPMYRPHAAPLRNPTPPVVAGNMLVSDASIPH